MITCRIRSYLQANHIEISETIHSRFTRTTYKNSLSLYLRYRGVNDYEQLLQGDPKIIQSQSRITRHNDQADAANPEIWSSLKRMFKEPHSEKYVFSKLSEYRRTTLTRLII